MQEAILYIAVAYMYILLCKLNYLWLWLPITRHIFIDFFQTKHFSAVKFYMGLWEKYELSCDTKISKSLEKSWKDRTGLL